MNFHGLVSGVVSAVNPLVPLTVKVNTGYTTDSTGKRTPTYAAPLVNVPGQVQNLTYSDLKQIEGLNLQGIRRAIYINGRVDGLVREGNKGGDIITSPDGNVWLVAHVLEYWPDWCKVAVTLQNGS